MRRHFAIAAILGMLLIPQPTVAVSPAGYTVRFSAFRTPVQRGHQARVAVHTAPDASCSIKVVYQNGKVSLPGLGAKRTNGSGNASWTWIVPSNATPRAWPVTVTCQSGGDSAKTSRSMTITR